MTSLACHWCGDVTHKRSFILTRRLLGVAYHYPCAYAASNTDNRADQIVWLRANKQMPYSARDGLYSD